MKRFRVPAFVRWFFFKRTWKINDHNAVVLTFDDGPTPHLTDWILDELGKHEIKASFFCVGANIEPCREQFDRILAEGHQVGNHTFSHEKGTEVDRDGYMKSIHQTNDLLQTELFRPPYGRLPYSFGKHISKNYRIIMWSWLSYDYDKEVKTEDILRSAEKDIRAGDILVLHDNVKVEERLKILLPALIKIVKDKGLEFKLISV